MSASPHLSSERDMKTCPHGFTLRHIAFNITMLSLTSENALDSPPCTNESYSKPGINWSTQMIVNPISLCLGFSQSFINPQVLSKHRCILSCRARTWRCRARAEMRAGGGWWPGAVSHLPPQFFQNASRRTASWSPESVTNGIHQVTGQIDSGFPGWMAQSKPVACQSISHLDG